MGFFEGTDDQSVPTGRTVGRLSDATRKNKHFYGDQAEQSLQNYHFDMLFLGVDAIDLERGVSATLLCLIL